MIEGIGNKYFAVLEAVGISAQLQPKTAAFEEMAVVTKLIVELSQLSNAIAIDSWHEFGKTLKNQAESATESHKAHQQRHQEEEGAYREHVWLCPFIERQVRAFDNLSADPLHCHCLVHLPV